MANKKTQAAEPAKEPVRKTRVETLDRAAAIMGGMCSNPSSGIHPIKLMLNDEKARERLGRVARCALLAAEVLEETAVGTGKTSNAPGDDKK